MSLASITCRQHAGRDAAAYCAGCQGPYCKECVAEHEGRILCSRCLEQEQTKPLRRSWPLRKIFWPFAALGSLFWLWIVFYGVASLLNSVPSDWYAGFGEWLFW